jgi:hypothetical protein
MVASLDESKDQTTKSSATFLREHIALVLSLTWLLFLLVKLYVVTRGDPSTAYGLVAASGPVLIFVGLCICEAGLLALLGSGICYIWYSSARTEGAEKYIAAAATATFGLVALAILPPLTALFMLPGLLGGFLLGRLSSGRERVGNVQTSKMMMWALASSVALVIVLHLLSSGMWLPQEVVRIKGAQPIPGYVVNEGEGWTTVLTTETRQLVRIKADSITARDLCNSQEESMWDSSLLGNIVSEPRSQRLGSSPECVEY